ncbi:YggT family protein [Desulfothermobacter acidiphilus]|uniref:YggT family protein n=1 Tax=Desulfothermobacter acidiphilus TaxID=1938353 RepID=UPI003F8BE0E2
MAWLNALALLVRIAFDLYFWLIIARVLLSWIPHHPRNVVIRFIYDVTEPYLSFFRRFIPPIGMLDLSPIVALFVLQLLKAFCLRLLAF